MMPIRLSSPVAGQSATFSHEWLVAARQYVVAVSSSLLFGLHYGFVIGYASPAVPDLVREGLIAKSHGAVFASAFLVGGFVGGPLGGWAVGAHGRQKTMVWSCIPGLVGWAVIILAGSVPVFVLGRFLVGVCCGAGSLCVPLYTAEVTCKHLRGKMTGLGQVGCTTGILLAYALGIMLNWMWLAGVALIPLGLHALSILFLPETPRWLLLKQRRREAIASLAWLQRLPRTADEIFYELEEMEEAISTEEAECTWSSFSHPCLYRPLYLSVMLMVFQQFCGISSIMYYAQSIFEQAGFTDSPGLPVVLLGMVKVLVTALSTSLLDKAGRRALFIIGGQLLAVSCSMFGLYFFLKEHKMDGGTSMLWLPLGSMLLYVSAFSLGWNTIPWLIMSEIFPVSARGKASTIVNGVHWSSAFLVTISFFHLQNLIQPYGIYWSYGFISIVGSYFVYKYLPETKNKTLEEIQSFFKSKLQSENICK